MPDEAIAQFDIEAQQRMWRGRLAPRPRPRSGTFVVELDGEVVGFVSVGASHTEEEAGECTRSTCTRRAGTTVPAER